MTADRPQKCAGLIASWGVEMSDKPKKVWYSKSNIFGVLQVAAGITGVLIGSEFVQQYPTAISVAVAISGTITIGLRLITSVPVEW